MTLSERSIRRPVLATVMSLLVVALGLLSAQRLPVRELPDTDPALVTVRADWQGAAPEAVDSQIIVPVEAAIAGVSGVRRMESRATQGSGRISLTFAEGVDVDAAAEDVRAAVANATRNLPDTADEPQVIKNDDDQSPVIRMGLTSDRMTPEQMTDYAQRNLVDRFATLPGVARADVSGRRTPVLRVELDPAAMAARQVTAPEIIAALAAGNVELPAGRITTGARVMQMRADTRLTSPEDFAALAIRQGGPAPVRLGDVAAVRVAAQNEETLVRSAGEAAVGLSITRQSQSNVVALSDAVRAEIERIRPTLPPGMRLRMSSDDAVFIKASTAEVLKTLAASIALVSLVILVFIGSPRAALAPLATIPVALIGALAGIYLLGYSINILTLFALILAIGLVVDDSIVVLEACQRRVERGEPPAAAAMRGSRAVTFAVLATTATLVSVFLPIGFLDGQVGRLFAEFGAVLAAAVIVSTFVALSLAPAICARVLRKGSGGMLERLAGWGFGRAEAVYRLLLRGALANPLVVTGLALAIALGAVWLEERIPQELAPKEDRGFLLMPINGPEGTNFETTLAEVEEIERRLQPLVDDGEAALIYSIIGTGGPHSAFMVIRLTDWSERERSAGEIAGSIIRWVSPMPGVRAFPIQPSGLGIRGSSAPLQAVVQGPDFERADAWAEVLAAALRETPGFANVEGGDSPGRPELRVRIDRAAAEDLGVSARDVATTLQAFYAGRELDGYMVEGRERPVFVLADESFRGAADGLGEIFVRSSTSGALVPLGAIAKFEETAAAPALQRIDRKPSATVTASLTDGLDLGEAIETVRRLGDELLPPGASIAWNGQSQEYLEASGGAAWGFAVALVVVYLVLAAQFESYLDPAAIMLSVPLSITGALGVLWWTGASANIYTQIGMILLVGLMAKNGILIVEYANQLRDRGMSVREAALEASVERLRPVVMTVVSTVLGAAPLVLSTGAGSEAREAIGWVVMGGFGFASVLTLFLTPVLWDQFARFTAARAARSDAIEAAMAEGEAPRGGPTAAPKAPAAPAQAPLPGPGE